MSNTSVSRAATPIPFQHFTKPDGTSDSICLRCHAVVASSHNEYSLEEAERTHICAQLDLLAHVAEPSLIWTHLSAAEPHPQLLKPASGTG
ncbi:MAG: hypothetical protein WCB58_20985, partial [Acidobacteriaceae bacterium]